MKIVLPRLFTAGFDGTSAPAELLRLIEAGLGGVILFARNIGSPSQLVRLVAELKRAASGRALVVAIDQEGGRVARLQGPPWARIPPARAFGALPAEIGAARAGALGRLLAEELGAAGIDLDFAPVLDTDTNPANPVIGDRAFSGDPHRVAALGAALITGMQSRGVAACGKHFPGHGDTIVDSHLELPRVTHARTRIDAVELVPFRAAVQAGVAAMMTAHLVCDALDRELPATLSPVVIRVLRTELGFDGPIVSDDLEMQAIATRWPIDRAAPLAIAAGCDQVLICRELAVVHRALVGMEQALMDGTLSEGDLQAAIGRWDRLADRYAHPPPDKEALAWLDSSAHQAAIAEALAGQPATAPA